MKTTHKNFFTSLKKEPLFAFLLISIGVYLIYGLFGTQDADTLAKDNTVTITIDEIKMMEFEWNQRYNRPPTEEEVEKLIKLRIRETVLAAEAKKMGLDKDDVVLRRRIVLQYKNLVESLIVPPMPNDEKLEAYFQEHLERYLPDPYISFTQLFFDPDKREETTLIDAEKAVEALQGKDVATVNAADYGDRFMLANTYSKISPLELRKYFGTGFEETLLTAETGKWVGPILSGYGTHVVFISEKEQAKTPELSAIKEEVLLDYMDEEKKVLVQLFMDNLISKYNIVIDKNKLATN